MSAIRNPATITSVGRRMMTAGGDITYTKAVLYGQDISHLTREQLESLTSIGNPLVTVPLGISDKNDNGNGTTVILEATFQNSNLKADLPYTAVGFFAKRGDDAEKLIAVGVATDGSYLAAASPDGVATDALDVKLAIAIGDASNVTAVIDPAGSVTPATLNAAISKVTHDLTAKIDVKADQDDTEKSLATKADKTTVESDLATKADQSSLDETNAEVAKKADSEDVTKQLATKANVSDVDDALSKKDDTADVDQKIATVNKSVSDLSDTVSANKTATDASLATKANASDVADNVKTLQANIDTKADKATVDAEIAKIDFTPYAKSADVANELQNYTTTVDLNKLLAGKEDAGTSYSKAELDKKLLALSTDTDGKVNADQVSSMIANKVDKSDLASDLKSINDSIATKANTTDVNAALAKKDDTTDVDAKIKTVIDLANTKADASDIYNKKAVDDAFSSRDATIATKADKTYVDNQIASIDFSKIKFRKQYVNSDGQTADKTWNATKNKDGTYTIDLWSDDWTASKLADVLVQLPNKADTSTVNAQIADAKNTIKSNADKLQSAINTKANQSALDATNETVAAKANSSDLTALDKKAVKSVGIYPNNLHFESGSFNYWSGEVKASPDANGYAVIDLADDEPVRAAADQLNVMLTGLNHLQGKQTKDSADANALSETGIYYCSSPAKNFPVSQWGTLVTSNGNGERASQFYFPDDNSAVWFRTLDGEWRGWVRLANIDDVNNAKSSLTSSINAVNDSINAVNNKVNVTVPLFRRITAANTWNDILGASNGSPVLVSIRDEGGANTLGNFSAAVAFGGGDTKGVLNVAYSDHTARIIGGNGDAPDWHEDIAWKSDISNLQNIINQQNQTIQSLTSRLNNAENEINYIKANYVEGRTFPASQEAQANSWENENPQRIAFITK